MAKITGIVKVYINGSLQRCKEGASLVLGGYERTAQTGHKVYGYTEKVVPSEMECTLVDMADTDLIELNNLVDATVRYETDTGKTYLVTNAFMTKPVKTTGGEGDVEVSIQGDPAVEE